MNNMAIALEIMAKGMGGIFVAIFVFFASSVPSVTVSANPFPG